MSNSGSKTLFSSAMTEDLLGATNCVVYRSCGLGCGGQDRHSRRETQRTTRIESFDLRQYSTTVNNDEDDPHGSFTSPFHYGICMYSRTYIIGSCQYVLYDIYYVQY